MMEDAPRVSMFLRHTVEWVLPYSYNGTVNSHLGPKADIFLLSQESHLVEDKTYLSNALIYVIIQCR